MRELAALLLLSSCGATGSEWPAFRGGPTNAAWVDLGALPAPREGWVLRPSPETRTYSNETGVYGSPAVAAVGGRPVMLVGCYDHNVYAVDIATGRELWRYSTGAPVYATPAVAELPSGPMVYVGSTDRTLYALDARDGSKVWARELLQWRASVGRASLASPALFTYRGGTAVLLCAWLHDRSAVQPVEEAVALAYDATTGQELWRLPLGRSELAAPGVTRDGNRWWAVVGSADGKAYGLDLDQGQVVWRRVLRGQIVGSPGIASGRRPLALLGTRYGIMHAFDLRTGEGVWSFRTAQGIDSTPAIAEVEGVLTAFFGSTDQTLYAVAALTGDHLWSFHTQGDVYSSPSVFHAGGQELVGFTSGDDRLHLLRAATGVEAWSISPGKYLWGYRIIGDSLWSSPVAVTLSGQTVLLLPFYDGAIHAYPVAAGPPAPDPVDPGYGRQMVRRAVLVMFATLGLCLWLGRKRQVTGDG
jgi:outer membrane protein assembly factor BamB